jgi:hypothetical protein
MTDNPRRKRKFNLEHLPGPEEVEENIALYQLGSFLRAAWVIQDRGLPTLLSETSKRKLASNAGAKYDVT